MATILDMQTEDVHQLAQRISWTTSNLWDRINETRHAPYRIGWNGSFHIVLLQSGMARSSGKQSNNSQKSGKKITESLYS